MGWHFRREISAAKDIESEEGAKRVQATISGRQSRIDVRDEKQLVEHRELYKEKREHAIRLKIERGKQRKLDEQLSPVEAEAKMKLTEESSLVAVESLEQLRNDAARHIEKGSSSLQRKHTSTARHASAILIQAAIHSRSQRMALLTTRDEECAAAAATILAGARSWKARKTVLDGIIVSPQCMEAAVLVIQGAITATQVRLALEIILIKAEECAKKPPTDFEGAAQARWVKARDAKMHLRVQLCRCQQRARRRKLVPDGVWRPPR